MTGAQIDTSQLLRELSQLPDGAALAALRALGDPAEILVELAEEASRLTMVDAAAAASAAQTVVGLAERCGSPLARCRALRAQARALSYAGRYHEALAACAEAATAAHELGRHDEAGRAALASMHALTELGRLDEAIAAGESARRAFIAIAEYGLAARADINLGVVHQRRDQPSAAVRCFDRARPLVVNDPSVAGHLDNNRGEALLALNDFAGAASAFAAALDTFESLGAAHHAAVVESNLADLAVRQGRLGRALRFFERARRRLESAGSPAHLARLLAEQAEAKALLGLREDALSAYQQALGKLDACGLALEAARARAGMGQMLFKHGRLAEAETALAAAATGFAELGHTTARARVDLVRCRLLARRGRGREAHRLALAALAVLDERPADAAAARHLLGTLALERGDLDRADGELSIGLGLAQRLDLAPLLADLLHARGQLNASRGRLEQARSDLEAAVAQVERIRGALQAERFRAAFLGQRAGVYEDLVGVILSDERPGALAAAFAGVERCKSRSLLDRLAAAVDQRDTPDDAGLAAELAEGRSRLSALYSRLADDEFAASGAAAIDEWRLAVREQERQLDELEARLVSAGGGEALFGAPAELSAVQAALGPGQVLIEYFTIGAEVAAIVVGAAAARIFRGLTTIARVREVLGHLEFQIARVLRPGAEEGRRAARLEREARHELAALYDALLRPLRGAIPAGSALVVVPHGPLHMVPFLALHDGERYVVEAHEVQLAPSASVWCHSGQRGTLALDLDAALVVGVSDDVAPGVEEEARRVAELLGCAPQRVLLGSEATAERVCAAAPQAPVIHLAGHGRFTPETPLGSGIMLIDRPLTARDIHSLRLGAHLVTLSACESGQSAIHAGDELAGLLNSFLAAGARAVLGSLWRVDDGTTLSFMREFYRAWDGGGTAASSALRQAQLGLLAQRPHPAFWAPFILVGRS